MRRSPPQSVRFKKINTIRFFDAVTSSVSYEKEYSTFCKKSPDEVSSESSSEEDTIPLPAGYFADQENRDETSSSEGSDLEYPPRQEPSEVWRNNMIEKSRYIANKIRLNMPQYNSETDDESGSYSNIWNTAPDDIIDYEQLKHPGHDDNSGVDECSSEHQNTFDAASSCIADSEGSVGSSSPQRHHHQYEAILANGDRAFFSEQKISGDGSCGFTILDTSRQELVNCLINLVADPATREYLVEEIQSALATGEFQASNTEIYNQFSEQRDILQMEYDAIFRNAREDFPAWRPGANGTPQTDQESDFLLYLDSQVGISASQVVSRIRERRKELLEAEEIVRLYCKEQEITEQYINAFRGNLWLGYKSMLLYAKENDINLYIWRKISPDSSQLTLMYSHECMHPGRIIDAIYVNGYTHFNLLVEEDHLMAERTQATIPEEKKSIDSDDGSNYEEQERLMVARPQTPFPGDRGSDESDDESLYNEVKSSIQPLDNQFSFTSEITIAQPFLATFGRRVGPINQEMTAEKPSAPVLG